MSSHSLPTNVHLSTHPCLLAKLSQLRSKSTSARETKALIHEIALILGVEALAAGLTSTRKGTDTSPLGYEFEKDEVVPSLEDGKVSLMPILRSGLGMVDAIQLLLPHAVPIHHLGLFRDKATMSAVEYYNNLPYHSSTSSIPSPGPSELVILLDPVIATGATACAAIDTLRDWGVKRVIMLSVIASAPGLRQAAELWPEGVEIWTAGVDEEVDGEGMIKPGLGDVGDRLFLTIGK